MIVVFVEHFLDEEGRRYFSDWIEEVDEVLQEFEGFISIQQLTDVEDPERCALLLQFERLDLLRAWADSDEHDRMIERLAPYQTRTQTSEIFRADPEHRDRME